MSERNERKRFITVRVQEREGWLLFPFNSGELCGNRMMYFNNIVGCNAYFFFRAQAFLYGCIHIFWKMLTSTLRSLRGLYKHLPLILSLLHHVFLFLSRKNLRSKKGGKREEEEEEAQTGFLTLALESPLRLRARQREKKTHDPNFLVGIRCQKNSKEKWSDRRPPLSIFYIFLYFYNSCHIFPLVGQTVNGNQFVRWSDKFPLVGEKKRNTSFHLSRTVAWPRSRPLDMIICWKPNASARITSEPILKRILQVGNGCSPSDAEISWRYRGQSRGCRIGICGEK